MSVRVTTYPSYTTNMTTFSIDYVNPDFLGTDQDLHKEAIGLLKEFIFNPNVDKNHFDKKLFKEQKNILKQNIINVYNNKNRYALRQLLNKMGENEITSVSVLGNLEDLELIDETSLFKMYQEFLSTETAKIFVIGDFDEEIMKENLKVLGNLNNGSRNLQVVSNEVKEITEVKEFKETQNINQAKLMMGFRTSVNSADDLYPASLVFNAMFGGTFQSDLVRVVREENSLAYTIASQMISDLKLLFVSAGIDSSKYEMTRDLVIGELEKFKTNELNDISIKLAKDSLISELEQIEDSPYAVINFYFKNQLNNIEEDVNSFIEKIKNVSKDDIRKVALGVQLDTIFLLEGDQNNA